MGAGQRDRGTVWVTESDKTNGARWTQKYRQDTREAAEGDGEDRQGGKVERDIQIGQMKGKVNSMQGKRGARENRVEGLEEKGV